MNQRRVLRHAVAIAMSAAIATPMVAGCDWAVAGRAVGNAAHDIPAAGKAAGGAAAGGGVVAVCKATDNC